MASRSIRSRRAPPTLHPEQSSRAKWTAPLTKILADLMVDQVQKGNRQRNSFGKKAWKFMCDEFYKKTGLKWDKDQLKNRFSVLRKQYGIMKSLLDQSDFKWDEATGAIIAKDEVWNRYIMEHPDVETVKSSGCPIYKQLCAIFSEPVMNGDHNRSNECKEIIQEAILCAEPLSTFREESSSESEEEADVAGEQDKLQLTIPPSTGGRKRGRKGIDNAIANAILEMAAASKLRADAIEQCNNRFSITDCVRALDELQGVDEQVYHAALELFNNPHARETFLSLKLDKRLMWLYSKCTALSSS
ncbi:L10-interacting MYB domain-containing protein-like [Cornus florida]|uniref:L10-interacting MYB domain-containing protein-like n=1 Tax=Cornus florida TaxID=4283 RepID=UPI00289C1553|nr:L10-interacting MYB domain-containing protein-like [Cornus florida]